ncbi:bactofilin family protein [Pleomorphovibrio marinus]|uniref:bactofilin family protein n=1 Tax=Pleomorphovibrio marinus TaxID=2164132 RepID=UPI000E0B0FFF|nr:polymer-forming cytoskeletal protein [Pleomorphovibrio marinus]
MASNNEDKKSTTAMVNSNNLVAAGTVIVGNIGTPGNIRVEGTVEGSLESQKKIIIGESAKVNGDVSANEVEVAGNVNGEIRCKDTLFLKKSALIIGDIFTKKLIIENGAEFNGKCQMGNQLNEDPKNIDHGKKKISS